MLFSDDPAGAAFWSNVLDGHTPEAQPAIRKQLHDSVGAFLGDGTSAPYSEPEDVYEQAASFTFTGRLDGLHTEVTVGKDGTPGNILVEIDRDAARAPERRRRAEVAGPCLTASGSCRAEAGFRSPTRRSRSRRSARS